MIFIARAHVRAYAQQMRGETLRGTLINPTISPMLSLYSPAEYGVSLVYIIREMKR